LEKSLVEKILVIPTQFRPVPLTESLPVFLQHKNKENQELQTRAISLVRDFKSIELTLSFKFNAGKNQSKAIMH